MKCAVFKGATLRGSILLATNLEGTVFKGANLDGASFNITALLQNDFKGAINLNEVTFWVKNGGPVIGLQFDENGKPSPKELTMGEKFWKAIRPTTKFEDTNVWKQLNGTTVNSPQPVVSCETSHLI